GEKTRRNHHLYKKIRKTPAIRGLARQWVPLAGGAMTPKTSGSLFQTEYILHVVKTGTLLAKPLARAHGAIGEGEAAGGLVTDLHPLANVGKHDGVLPHQIAGTNGGKAGGVALPLAGDPFTAIDGALL